MAKVDVKNFAELEELYKSPEHRPELSRLVAYSQKITRELLEKGVDVASADRDTVYQLATEHGFNAHDYLDGRSIPEIIPDMRTPEKEQEEPPVPPANPLIDFSSPSVSLFNKKAEFLQEDHDYVQLKDDLLKEWLKANPKKNLSSSEAIEYIHGGLFGEEESALERDAKRRFEIINPKNAEKMKKYTENKAKVYKKSTEDPYLAHVKESIHEETADRYKFVQDQKISQSYQDVHEIVKAKKLDQFVREYKEKAQAYANEDNDIQEALARVQEEEKAQEQQKQQQDKSNTVTLSEKNKKKLEEETEAEEATEAAEETATEEAVGEEALAESAEEGLIEESAGELGAEEMGEALGEEAASEALGEAGISAEEAAGEAAEETMSEFGAEAAGGFAETEEAFVPIEGGGLLGEASADVATGAALEGSSVASTAAGAAEGIAGAAGAVEGAAVAGAEGVAATGALASSVGGATAAAVGAAEGATGTAAALGSNPVGWVAIVVMVVVFVIILIVVLLSGSRNFQPDKGNNNQAPTQDTCLSLNGPDAVKIPISPKFGEEPQYIATYNITITCDHTTSGVLSYNVPASVSFISATGVYKTLPEGSDAPTNIVWELDKNDKQQTVPQPGQKPVQYYFSITVYTNIKNFRFTNQVTLTLPEQITEPTKDTCEGKIIPPYNLISPYHNFGDPTCTYSIDQLDEMLKSLDPINALKWHNIARCESGAQPPSGPNAYNPNSTSGKGAYGLFQMNPKGQGNGEYDAGNVPWASQIQNAIMYNKLIHNSFAYWECARR